MSKPPPPPAPSEEMVLTWTTWEELLLTCAVKRHGLKDWESVAMELQNRSSQPLVLTAQICRNKYNDLKRRFIDENGSAPAAGDSNGDSIPWLEELRKLRVAELKQEVHRHDLSIQSLQLKVKRLEEEREKNSIENDKIDNAAPDLKNEPLDAEKTAGTAAPVPENVTGKSVSGEYSDRDSRTLNESNSAENRGKTGDAEPEPVQTGPVLRDPEVKPIAEDSCNDSSDTVAKIAASKPSLEKRTESNELRNNSGAESKERITTNKESSDVQSSASLTKKIRRRGVVVGGGEEKGGSGGGGATVKREVVKSEPLVGFLDIFRSHKHGSIFERRLDIQKTDKYKNTVRQHVDLETIQTRIEDGSYSSCPTKFYSDLLLFNNATVFFPKDSNESAAAIELRSLVLKEIKKKQIGRHSPEPAKTQPKRDPEKPDPEKSDPLLSKHKTSVPIVVCRKRSSITTKTGSSSKQPEEKPVTKPKPDSKTDLKPVSKNANEDDSSSIKFKGKEKPVTGVRSMRRSSNNNGNSNNNRIVNTTMSSKGSNLGALGKAETGPKGEKKKVVAAVVAPGKKSGAADFLKRIKRNSPAKGSAEESSGGSGRREQQKKRVVEEKKEVTPVKKKVGGGGGGGNKGKEESSPSKRNVGRPPKRVAEAVVPAKRRREVDGGGGGGEGEGGSNTKRPKKRTKR